MDWESDESDDEVDRSLHPLSRRRYQLFFVDIRRGMLSPYAGSDGRSTLWAALEVIQESLRQYIIEGSSLLRTGVTLAGRVKRDALPESGIFDIVSCDAPTAEGVLAVRELAEAAARHTDLNAPIKMDSHAGRKDPGLGAGDEFPLLDCLHHATSVFKAKAKATDECTVIIFTNDSNPVANPSGVQIKCGDMRDAGYRVIVQPVGVEAFDASVFWNDVTSSPAAALHEEDANYEQAVHSRLKERVGKLCVGGGVLQPLSKDLHVAAAALRRRVFVPRPSAHLPLTLSPGVHLSIQVFKNISIAKKPSAICLDAHTLQQLKRFTRFVRNDVEAERSVPSLRDAFRPRPAEAEAGVFTSHHVEPEIMASVTDPMSNKRVAFSQTELAALKSFSGVDGHGLRIIGFQDRSLLKDVDNLESPFMVYPYEREITGSTQVFAALWQSLIQKNKIAIARYVRTKSSEPKYVALVPERERVRANGEQDVPPCLYAVTLHFASDRRSIPVDAVAATASVPQSKVDAARQLVLSLQRPEGFDFFHSPPSNPHLQAFYNTLEGIALNLRPDQIIAPRDDAWHRQTAQSRELEAAIAAFGDVTREPDDRPVQSTKKRTKRQ
jgi:hypothetical protein